MATSHGKTVRQVKNQPIKAKGSWFLKHKALIIISIVIVAFIAWFNSDYWPWPSRDRINERLDKVLSICTDNEYSSECKNIQKRYNMTFKYCRSMGDLSRKSIFEMDWYAVAWEGTSSEPPKNEIKLPNGTTMPGLNTYYGCQEHIK